MAQSMSTQKAGVNPVLSEQAEKDMGRLLNLHYKSNRTEAERKKFHALLVKYGRNREFMRIYRKRADSMCSVLTD